MMVACKVPVQYSQNSQYSQYSQHSQKKPALASAAFSRLTNAGVSC